LRTVLPFTLGIAGVPGRIFIPLNILGALLWSIAITSAGYLFGQALETFFGRLKHVELWIMLGIAVLGGVAWAVHFCRVRQKPRNRSL
jgi:membrane protein DedA with SNARE-associated domain